MCNADTGIITYEWVDGWLSPRPDYNTVHRCRNFDKIQNWNDGHSARVPAYRITRSADTVDLPEAP
jgi:Mycotoxin biosynthesis protein UstYa